MQDVVLFEELNAGDKVIGVATLNSEKSLNALSLAMAEKLLPQLKKWAEDDKVACVWLQGAGEKAFCAGGDIVAMYKAMQAEPGKLVEEVENFFTQEYQLDYFIQTFPKPLICWGDGIVMGGGMGLMNGASHRIVTERSLLAMPEVTIGLYPDVGGSYFLNRMPENKGLFLALTGANFNAADALYLKSAEGFIEHQYQEEVLDALADTAWSTGVADNHERVLDLLKGFTDRCAANIPAGNVEAAAAEIDALCQAGDDVAVIEAIANAESDNTWVQKAAAALKAGSPLSARIIIEQLRRTHGASLKEVFKGELALSTQIVRGTEFAEGVRALLIDKDRNPAWKYATAAEIPAEELARMFESPWEESPLADL